MRFIVIQFSSYLTNFRKALLSTRYGVALRNLIYVKPDKKLYFLDNIQDEYCLSHPAWASIAGKPEAFPSEEHSHNYVEKVSENRPGVTKLYQKVPDEGVSIQAENDTIYHTLKAYNEDGTPAAECRVYYSDYADMLDGEHATAFAQADHTHPRIVGELILWPVDTPPAGWLLCNGQAVSRSTYAELFALIGTTYGSGNGSTTFNVPDLRGRVPLGQDDMGGSSANRVTAAAADLPGGSGGAETHTLTTAEMPSHTHVQNAHTHGLVAGTSIFEIGVGSKAVPGAGSGAGNTSLADATATNQNAGGGSPHNNMPPYLTLNFVIYAGA